jgi:hypothetical protein
MKQQCCVGASRGYRTRAEAVSPLKRKRTEADFEPRIALMARIRTGGFPLFIRGIRCIRGSNYSQSKPAEHGPEARVTGKF